MAKGTRRNHGASFKAKVALAALKGDKTVRTYRKHKNRSKYNNSLNPLEAGHK